MFFNRRKKWNANVASLMPTFGLDIKKMGVMSSLEALDLVYPKGYSAHEGALYLAYVTYTSMLKNGTFDAAEIIKIRLGPAESEWANLSFVNPKNVEAWREHARKIEEDVGL